MGWDFLKWPLFAVIRVTFAFQLSIPNPCNSALVMGICIFQWLSLFNTEWNRVLFCPKEGGHMSTKYLKIWIILSCPTGFGQESIWLELITPVTSFFAITMNITNQYTCISKLLGTFTGQAINSTQIWREGNLYLVVVKCWTSASLKCHNALNNLRKNTAMGQSSPSLSSSVLLLPCACVPARSVFVFFGQVSTLERKSCGSGPYPLIKWLNIISDPYNSISIYVISTFCEIFCIF